MHQSFRSVNDYRDEIRAEALQLTVVNLTIAKVDRISFDAFAEELYDIHGIHEKFTDCHLQPFGGSVNKRIYLKRACGREEQRKFKFTFRYAPSHNMQIPEETIEFPVIRYPVVGRNFEFFKEFRYKIEYLVENTSGMVCRCLHFLEVVIHNSMKHELICSAEGMFNLGQRLAEIGNNEDAARSIENAKFIVREADPGLAGDFEEIHGKDDAKIYADKTRIYLAAYFKADKNHENLTAEIELTGATSSIKQAVKIDPDSEDFQKLESFVNDINEIVLDFEYGREKEGDAMVLDVIKDYEYAIYKCEEGIEKFNAIQDRLQQWLDNHLEIEGLDNTNYRKYTRKLASAKVYLTELEELYENKLNEEF